MNVEEYSCGSSGRGGEGLQLMSWRTMRALISAVLVMGLAGCRLLFEFEGAGVLVAESSGTIYHHGDQMDISGAFEDSFRPVPMPGHRFLGWGPVCKKRPTSCSVRVSASAAELDVDAALEPRFAPEYSGPLRLTGGSFFDNELPPGDFLRIPDGSLDIEGRRAAANDLRLFLATNDLSYILAGTRSGGGFDFTLEPGAPGFESLYLFISAVDSDGVLASVAFEFDAVPAEDAAALRPYRSNSPYADAIAGCVSASDAFKLCNLNTLPLLGMETDDPSLEQILQRTVISHDWMGVRFEQLMQRMPADVYRMMRGVTAVVISSNVRPAYYFPPTGAIHLDPAFLWLTNAEKATISKDEDFRLEFAQNLNFEFVGLYMNGGNLAHDFYSLDDERQRSLADAELEFASLMFHELAHANDFAPPARMSTLDGADTVLDVFYKNEAWSATTQLEASLPLRSELLHQLAAIRWGGAEPTPMQRSVSGRQAGIAFEGEAATSFYAYYTGYEDTAMLAEAALMNYHYGADLVAAFVNRVPDPDLAACNDYVVGWGQRNRLDRAEVAARVELVLQTTLGVLDASPYTSRSAPIRDLQTGVGLCTSLFSGGVQGAGAAAPTRLPSATQDLPPTIRRRQVTPPRF